MAFSNTLISPILLMVLLFFFLTSVISCNTDNEPCPPTLPGSSPYLPGTPVLPEIPPYLPGTPVLPETPPYLPGTPIFPETPPYLPGTPTYLPETPVLPQTPVIPLLPYPPILPTTPIPYQPVTPTPVTPTSPCPPTVPTTPIPKYTNRNTCPKDVLKLGVCTDMLGRSIGRTIGSPPTTPCCKILEGLLDFEAAICLCTAIKANVLGVVFNFPIVLNNVFNHCNKNNPSGFQCE